LAAAIYTTATKADMCKVGVAKLSGPFETGRPLRAGWRDLKA